MSEEDVKKEGCSSREEFIREWEESYGQGSYRKTQILVREFLRGWTAPASMGPIWNDKLAGVWIKPLSLNLMMKDHYLLWLT